jgi:4-methyl-5(b-hydroxyethyl)-thiazole monophosphate biosynthesis
MKGLIILANGFEDTEAIMTIDILRRAKLSLTVASAGDDVHVKSQSGLYVKAETTLKDVNDQHYDFLVLPGGRAVKDILEHSKKVLSLIDKFVLAGKMVAAICAAPLLLGRRGYFKDQVFTCFPGCEVDIKEGKYKRKKGVIRSGKFITARAMGYTAQFAYEIVEYLLGKEARAKVEKNCNGEL